MDSIYLYVLGSTALLTVIANLAVKVVPVKSPHISAILSYFSALAAGTLLGDAFVYLIPKATETTGWTTGTTIAALGGVLLMMLFEQFITWDEVKKSKQRSKRHHAAMSNMFGFTSQSFVDGLVIASGYLVSTQLGIATTLAVVIHQIPQEISNFVILRRAGISNKLASRINTLAVFTAFFGALVAILLPELTKQLSLTFIAPFTAGVFVYIALAQLVPNMLMEKTVGKGTKQLGLVVVGIFLIVLVKISNKILGGLD